MVFITQPRKSRNIDPRSTSRVVVVVVVVVVGQRRRPPLKTPTRTNPGPEPAEPQNGHRNTTPQYGDSRKNADNNQQSLKLYNNAAKLSITISGCPIKGLTIQSANAAKIRPTHTPRTRKLVVCPPTPKRQACTASPCILKHTKNPSRRSERNAVNITESNATLVETSSHPRPPL